MGVGVAIEKGLQDSSKIRYHGAVTIDDNVVCSVQNRNSIDDLKASATYFSDVYHARMQHFFAYKLVLPVLS